MMKFKDKERDPQHIPSLEKIESPKERPRSSKKKRRHSKKKEKSKKKTSSSLRKEKEFQGT